MAFFSVKPQSCQVGLKLDSRKNGRKWPQLSLQNVLSNPFVLSEDTNTQAKYKHSHTLTFQEDTSDDIWSDSMSPTWFVVTVSNIELCQPLS